MRPLRVRARSGSGTSALFKLSGSRQAVTAVHPRNAVRARAGQRRGVVTLTEGARLAATRWESANTDDECAGSTWERVRHQVMAAHDSSVRAHPSFVRDPKTVEIIGAPMTFGQPLAGADFGPELIRSKGLRGALTQLDWRVRDSGDLKFDEPSAHDPKLDMALGKAKNCHAVGHGCRALCEQVSSAIEAGRFPLIIGGDHSIGLGSVSGALKQRPDTGVLWVDAHADINTPASSPSGNIHGMPIAIAMKLAGADPSLLPGMDWASDIPALAPENVVYVGLRDVDEGEVRLIRELGIKCFTMKHVDRYGIGDVMDNALNYIAGRPIHMSFDIDAIDPVEAPSTGTLVRGGLTYREAQYICETVFESGRLASMDMVEVNPTLSADGDGAHRTAELAMALIESAMGNSILPRMGDL